MAFSMSDLFTISQIVGRSTGSTFLRRDVGWCGSPPKLLSSARDILKTLGLKSKESVLWSHCVDIHDGAKVQFKMKAPGYFADPLTQQVEEAVRIFHTSNHINRKGEWKKTAIPRATYARE